MDINNGGDDESAANDAVVFIYDGVNEAPDNVTHVRFLPTVTVIPEGAFQDRYDLRDVELPEGLIKISERSFYSCMSLKSINFPNTIQEIEVDAFIYCKNLEGVVLPTGLRILGPFAFYGCRSLKSIHIPSNVRIDDFVFTDCFGLTKVTISEGSESIGRGPFNGCKSLVSVKLPSSLKVIGEEAFCKCERLSDMNLSYAVETIQVYAFSGTSFQNFRMPPLVTDVNISMFERCNCLVSIELSSHVRNINDETETNDIDTIQLNKVRNIALPPECTLSADMDLYMLEIFEDLRVAFPNGEDRGSISHALKHRFDNLPIHKICYYQSYHDAGTVLRDLRREINLWTSKFPGQLNPTGKQQDCLGMTPLHILACSTKQDVELYQLLIGKYPEILITKDKWGDIPLLYAFWCNVPDEVIELMVESYKTKHPDYVFDWRGMLQTLSKARLPLAKYSEAV